MGCREILREYLEERLDTLVKNIPKNAQPVLSEKNQVVTQSFQQDSQPYETKKQSANIQPRAFSGATSEERKLSTSELDDDAVRIGTKLLIRYLNGPRAGVAAKFWFQETTNDPRIEKNGYKSVGTDSPLGEALESGKLDDIVSFTIRDDEIRVQIIELHQAQR